MASRSIYDILSIRYGNVGFRVDVMKGHDQSPESQTWARQELTIRGCDTVCCLTFKSLVTTKECDEPTNRAVPLGKADDQNQKPL